jgi:hypothetical protein
MAKDTYRNELDRLLNPLFNTALGHAGIEPYPYYISTDPEETEVPDAQVFRFGTANEYILVAVDWETVVLKDDGMGGTMLYCRDECGDTHTLRPGCWVAAFLDEVLPLHMETVRGDIESARFKAEEQAATFVANFGVA